jgi:lipoprotein-releasing system permease protein
MRGAVANALAPFDRDIADYPAWRVQTWEQRQNNLLRAVNNEKFLLAFVLFFIVFVACFGIFATLTMTVAEKTRDIGVLRALGATPGGILSIFVLNGTLVGLIGTLCGYGAGILVANNVNVIRAFLKDTFGWDIFPPEIYLFDDIPTHVDHRAALMFALSTLCCAFVFAFIPAYRASRLRPVRALRYE